MGFRDDSQGGCYKSGIFWHKTYGPQCCAVESSGNQDAGSKDENAQVHAWRLLKG